MKITVNKELNLSGIITLLTIMLSISIFVQPQYLIGHLKEETIIPYISFSIFLGLMSSLFAIVFIIRFGTKLISYSLNKKIIKSNKKPLTQIQKQSAIDNLKGKIVFYEYVLDESHSKYDLIRIASTIGENKANELLLKREELVSQLHQSKNLKNKVLDDERLTIEEINTINTLIKYNKYYRQFIKLTK